MITVKFYDEWYFKVTEHETCCIDTWIVEGCLKTIGLNTGNYIQINSKLYYIIGETFINSEENPTIHVLVKAIGNSCHKPLGMNIKEFFQRLKKKDNHE